MTLTQLEYIIAVYKHKSFSKASKSCFVTQPTLSQQIIKLEDILQIKIFDRDCSPVRPTLIGEKVIAQAMKVIYEAKRIKEIIDIESVQVKGELRIGIIPSIADSLIPLFLKHFSLTYPLVKLSIFERQTEHLVSMIKSEEIDVGIAATPLRDQRLKEKIIYYEPFSIYLPKNHKLLEKRKIKVSDLDSENLLLLSDGHCFKDQVTNFCHLRERHREDSNINFQSGSFETLIRLVDKDLGCTILPRLVCENLRFTGEKSRLRLFSQKTPLREVSMIFRRGALKQKLLAAVHDSITENIPTDMLVRSKKSVLLDPV